LTVLALPQDVLRKFDNAGLYEFLPEVSRLHYLRSNPFSALDVHFKRPLPGMQARALHVERVSVRHHRFFDISQHWPG